ncbi:MAG: O-antigen ligase family protein [Patescibacteria group bacterium]
MKLFNFCSKVIEYSFYLLFFLVPLAFTSDTSELFEFNKLWVTFILTVVIGSAWITKMIIKRELRIQKTLLDIPIALFLGSQIISTFLSLDIHTSIWGYYSRFNGGLLSIFAYVFLYYAFVTNLKDEEKNNENKTFHIKNLYIFIAAIVVFIAGILISSQIKASDSAGIPFQMLATLLAVFASFAVFMKASPKGIIAKSLYAILSSAVLVILWGLPSHFGYDPTCLLFRGTFDVSCWTADFQPKVRIFSTLGQPAWLAAYLVTLLPVLVAFLLNFVKTNGIPKIKSYNFALLIGLILLPASLYLALLYTQSRAAIASFWLILPLLLFLYFWFFVKPTFNLKKISLEFKTLIFILVLVLGITFFAGQPFGQLSKFTFTGLKAYISKPAATETAPKPPAPTPPPAVTTELAGSDSGRIRLLVWRGAIDIWKNNPIFGTGLETYAFAYYKYRPAEHNLVSEWQFLYNKAHNEFLNYLATTGTVGIATYLFMIGSFIFVSVKNLYKKREKLSNKDFIAVSLLLGYGGILFTNFFGFSVVIINIFFYLIPAFIFILLGLMNYDKSYSLSFSKKEIYALNIPQKISLGVIALVFLYLLFTLTNFWNADRKYYFGSNYNRAGDYQRAYAFLQEAIKMRPSEPTFRDELAYNNAVLGSAILAQSQQQKENQEQNIQVGKQLIDTAIKTTNQVTSEHPNNIVFLKTKVRVFYTLSQIDPSYLPMALEAIKNTQKLAPTDADVSYNLGVLYGQTGDAGNAVKTLENTIKLKPDYKGGQAYYALGIFYRQLSVDEKGVVVNKEYNNKAIETMKLVIKYFGPNQQAEDAIKSWQK